MNPYETAARLEKATRLANQLFAGQLTVQMARRMDDRLWAMAAKAAGVKVPSQKTRALTLELLGRLEEATAANAGLDPFRGF